jgi:hypothetical protein
MELRVAGSLGQRLVQWRPDAGGVAAMKTASGSALASVVQISDNGRAGVQRRKQQHSKASSHGTKVSSSSSKQAAEQQHWHEASSGTVASHGVAAANGKQAMWRPSQGQLR